MYEIQRSADLAKEAKQTPDSTASHIMVSMNPQNFPRCEGWLATAPAVWLLQTVKVCEDYRPDTELLTSI